jgi:hypothetical protein
MSTRLLTSLAAVIGALAAAVLVAGGVAVATHDTTTLHACAQDRTGALRLVADAGQCTRGETAVEWNT